MTNPNSIPCSVHCNFSSADSDTAKDSLFNQYFFSVFTTPLCHPAPPNVSDDCNMLSELNISAQLKLWDLTEYHLLFYKNVLQFSTNLFAIYFLQFLVNGKFIKLFQSSIRESNLSKELLPYLMQ